MDNLYAYAIGGYPYSGADMCGLPKYALEVFNAFDGGGGWAPDHEGAAPDFDPEIRTKALLVKIPS